MGKNNLAPAVSGNLLQRATDYVLAGKGLEPDVEDVVGLVLPIGGEADERVKQVNHIVKLLEKYHADPNVERPLSIAVFGPPGSGKSTFVKRITKAVPGCSLVDTMNLTQIGGTAELGTIIATALDVQKKVEVAHRKTQDPSRAPDPVDTPVFFFDEFDAALDGVPLGWLRWFLAPMQDGVLNASGRNVNLRKAVFMFAGGTAETLDEFNHRARLDPEAYRARKTPDFVSRLRGSIDIGGVNEPGDARIVPRALVLQRLLRERVQTLTPERVRQFLTEGHFVHGVRSMIMLLDAGWGAEGTLDLPVSIRRQHFSRGDLDGQRVGISAGLKEPEAAALFEALTTQLLRSGASIAYGGAFAPEGTLEMVLKAAKQATPEIGDWDDRSARVRNYLGYPASTGPRPEEPEDTDRHIDFIALDTISEGELGALGAPTDHWFEAIPDDPEAIYDPRRHVAWALSLFRMRVRMMQDLSALVVLGGKDDGRSWGRAPGIAEEVMIALALGKPIFVLGGAGGAAHGVGRLLGLDAAPASLDRCLKSSAHPIFDHALAPYASSFEIPGEPGAPRDLAELRRYLFHRGVTTAAWPRNGLDVVDNRRLFACSLASGPGWVDEAVGLIVRGLLRIGWKIPGEAGGA